MAHSNKSVTVEKSLIKKVQDLMKENKSLRKRVSKLRKIVGKADISIIHNDFNIQKLTY